MEYHPHLRLQAAPPTTAAPSGPDRVLWNFTAPGASVSDWTESSDGTAREAGMSTGAFKLQVRSTGASGLQVRLPGSKTAAWSTVSFKLLRSRAPSDRESLYRRTQLR